MVWLALRNLLLGLTLGFALTAPPASAQEKADKSAPKPAQIDRNGVLMLVRSAVLAVHHANTTGNYTVLRDLGSPGFQQANTAVRLGEIFAELRGRNFDLTGVVVLDPQLTLLPQIEASGIMHMAGFFPSVPLQVNFELMFAPVDGKWKLFGVALNLGQSGPTAPGAPSAAQGPDTRPAASPAPQKTQAAPKTPPRTPELR
jgi:hypothetical protein